MKLGSALIKVSKLRTKPGEYEYHPARRALMRGGVGAALGGGLGAVAALLNTVSPEMTGLMPDAVARAKADMVAPGLVGAGVGGLAGLLSAAVRNRSDKKEKQTAQAMALYAKAKGMELLPGGELHEGKMYSKSKGTYAEPADAATQKEVRKSTPPGYDASYAMRWEKMTPKNRAMMDKVVAMMKKQEALEAR